MGLPKADIRSTYFLNGTSPYFFYNEIYLHACEIYIALGYFSKSAFCIGTDALLSFIKRGGKIHLICNEKILPEDAEAISYGYELQTKAAVTIHDFEQLVSSNKLSSSEKFSYRCLAYMIGLGQLDIKVAKSERLVHFKIGYAIDEEGNIVAFSGSVNYTLSALLFNWEQLTTYCSWRSPEVFLPRIREIVDPINTLFAGQITGLPLIEGKEIETYIKESYPVSGIEELENEASLERKKFKVRIGVKEVSPLADGETPFFVVPSDLSPRPHQIDALQNYEDNNCKSLFAMATGTGKTLTALFAANDLCYSHDVSTILILVPLSDLVVQWTKDVKKFFDGLIIQVGSRFNEWRMALEDYKIGRIINPGKRAVIISTYDSYTLNYEVLKGSLNLEKTLLIADEVHSFGSFNRRELLPDLIPYRIGLSATPKRSHDEAGTKAVFDFFCPSENPFVFDIEKAIHAGFLCEYFYHPVFVHLTDDEYSEYEALSEKISRLSAIGKLDGKRKDELTLLAKKRHRLIENAQNKLDAVIEYFEERIKDTDFSKTIVFCPEGKNEDDDNINTFQAGIWAVFRKNRKRIRMAQYVGGSSADILTGFSMGTIDMLLAKKRLNEGIDIPSTRRALFISSSTAEREFIQRRGRVLRLSEGKEYAEIIDFIVAPPLDSGEVFFKNEMDRFLDFAKTAKNSVDAMLAISNYM